MSMRTNLLRDVDALGGIGATARGANFKGSKMNTGNEIKDF